MDEGSPGERKSHLLGLHFVVESLIFTNTLDGGLVGASKETNAVLYKTEWRSYTSKISNFFEVGGGDHET